MNKKKWIIITGLMWVVSISMFYSIYKWMDSKKPTTEPATTEVVIPEEKFEYVKITAHGKEIECKYAKFDPPLKVDRLKGIQGIDPNTKIQWLQFVKYTTDISDSSREFNPEMYNPDRKDRLELYRDYWSKNVTIQKDLANTLLEEEKKTKGPLQGIIKGILFLRYNQVEYAIFSYDYKNENHAYNTGKVAVVDKKKLIFFDDEIYKLDLDLTYIGSDQDEIIEKLSQSEHGILTVKDPLNWNLR